MPPIAKPSNAPVTKPTTSTDTTTSPAAKPGAKPKAEAVPNEELVTLITQYDEAIDKAQSYYVEFIEFVQTKQLGRAEVVASIMKARGCGYETAQSQFSRMKNIMGNKEVLQELKDGTITLKVAKERTTAKQANPKNAKPEAKQERYDKNLKAFVDSVKECGYDLKSAIMGVEAELKSAGVK